MTMNYIDITITVLLVVFGIGGWRKGIIIEAATLLGLGLGLYGAFRFSDFTADKLTQVVEISPKYLHVVAFIVTFVVLAIVVNLLGRLLTKLVKAINLGFVDKIGGFLVGLAKGLLICSLVVMLLNALPLQGVIKEETKQESVLYPYVEMAVPYVYQGYDLVREAVGNVAAPEPSDAQDPVSSSEEVSGSEDSSESVPVIVL